MLSGAQDGHRPDVGQLPWEEEQTNLWVALWVSTRSLLIGCPLITWKLF